jgi:hypothetical protein
MLAGDSAGVWTVTVEEKPSETGVVSLLTMLPAKEKECKHSNWGSGDIYGHVTRGRRLIITAEGYMGLAPFYVEEEQKLAILNRCSAPVLLTENEDGTYTLREVVLSKAGWKGRSWRSLEPVRRRLGVILIRWVV